MSTRKFDFRLIALIAALMVLALVGCSPMAGAQLTEEPLPTEEPTTEATEAPTEVATESATEPAAEATDEGRIPAPPAELVGVWEWIAFEDFGEGTSFSVEDPTKYTIKFNDDNTYEIVADCNSGGGAFRALEGGIVIEPGASTLVECEEGSLYDEFFAKLGAVATYVLQDGKLYLNLMMDSGNMVFQPQA